MFPTVCSTASGINRVEPILLAVAGQSSCSRLCSSPLLAGLTHRHLNRNAVLVLVTIAVTGLLSIWVIATQTGTYEARYAFVGLAAIAGLAALGLERWRLLGSLRASGRGTVQSSLPFK